MIVKKQKAHNQKDICDVSQAFLVRDLEFLQKSGKWCPTARP